jgi:hypothetical protein
MALFEKCDWRCAAILAARKADAYPAVWNSLTFEEQVAFNLHIHPRPRNLADFGAWIRRLLLGAKPKPCPTCGRP